MVVTNACAPDPRVLRHAVWMQAGRIPVTVHAFDREERHPMSENHHGVSASCVIGSALWPTAAPSHVPRHPSIPAVVERTLFNDPPALVYCHDADTLQWGATMKNGHGIPFVFDMHDLQHTWVRYAAPQSTLAQSGQRTNEAAHADAWHRKPTSSSSQQVWRTAIEDLLSGWPHHGLEGSVVESTASTVR